MLEGIEFDIFNRASLLLGRDAIDSVSEKKVIIFGVGGVGSWCAEGLVRGGVKHLTMVDVDTVSVSNINRQLQATTKTVGLPKVDVLRDRLLEINPNAEIIALNKAYGAATAHEFNLDEYDYIIDAIDSLKDKITLILNATASRAKFYSAMGAALKLDPTKIRVAEFWDVKGCPLGSILRKRLRQAGTFPSKKFLCVYDEEVLENKGADEMYDQERELGQIPSAISKKAQINGSVVHITAIFGMTLSGLVIQDIVRSL